LSGRNGDEGKDGDFELHIEVGFWFWGVCGGVLMLVDDGKAEDFAG
jgi:hypothetical protein